MPPLLSKVANKKLHGQSREIVSNVLKFFIEEAKNWEENNFLVPVKQCQLRCSKATGVSVSTVKRINKEGKFLHTGTVFATPDKSHVKTKTVTHLDDFNKAIVRRTIHSFYTEEKCLPTINKLRLKLTELINYQGGNSSLRHILKDLGFNWRKTKNNRKLLIENEGIRNKRINYIRLIRKYRQEQRPIVYTDESYVVTTQSARCSWQDDSNQGLHTPVSGGDRIIIVHAGGANGFIPNAFLQWKASQAKGDYHHNMNQGNYEKWVKEKLLPNLQPNSVLIMDNASYYNVKLEKVPTKSSKKAEMQEWLLKNNIEFSERMFKAELFQLIVSNKPSEDKYSVDEMIKEKGHTVLRLPPYHPDLNPIELIWSQLKRYVSDHNTTFNIRNIMTSIKNKIDLIGQAEWEKCCDHVMKIEDEYVEREGIMDDFVDRIIINLSESDSEDNSDVGMVSSDEDDLSGFEEM